MTRITQSKCEHNSTVIEENRRRGIVGLAYFLPEAVEYCARDDRLPAGGRQELRVLTCNYRFKAYSD